MDEDLDDFRTRLRVSRPSQNLIDPAKSITASSKFIELFVNAALSKNTLKLLNALHVKMRFYYIRMVILGQAMDDELQDTLLSRTLVSSCGGSPRGGQQLDELIRGTIHGISEIDAGRVVIGLLDNLPFVDEVTDAPEATNENRIAQEAIGATFNVFFLWLAIIIAGTENQPEPVDPKKAKKSSKKGVEVDMVVPGGESQEAALRVKELLAKRLEYDNYLVDQVLPKARKSTPEHASMAELLSKMREYANYSMSYIFVRAIEQGESAITGLAVKDDILALLWSVQCKCDMKVWARGIWLLEYTSPTPLMPVIAASKQIADKTLKEKDDSKNSYSGGSHGGSALVSTTAPIVKSVFHNMVKGQRLNLKFQLAVTVSPSKQHLEVNVGVENVRCKVDNSRWDNEYTGHFPSHLYLCLTPMPVVPGLRTSKILVLTSKSSSGNTQYQYKYGESIGASVGGSAENTGMMGYQLGVQAGVSSKVTAKSKPWEYEHVRVGESGGALKWSLQHWEGKAFDRLLGPPQAQKASIFKFGRRPVNNYLVNLPLSSDGGIIFSEADYPEPIKWKFPKDMEGKLIMWKVEGRVDTTFMTKEGFFETRAINFKQKLDWILLADPDEKKGKDKEKDNDKDKDKDKDNDKDKEKDKDKDKGKEKDKEKKKDKDGVKEEMELKP